MDYVALPPREALLLAVERTCIRLNFEHALLMINTLLCVLFKDYHLIHLKTDVLLLADVFENFRSMCISYYKLHPAHYMSSLGYSWDRCMLMSKAKLDLKAIPDMLDMIERSKRRGLCYVSSKRYVKANNHYLPDCVNSQDENISKMKLQITCMHGHSCRLRHTKT